MLPLFCILFAMLLASALLAASMKDKYSYIIALASSAAAIAIVSAMVIEGRYGNWPSYTFYTYISQFGISFSFALNAFSAMLSLMVSVVVFVSFIAELRSLSRGRVFLATMFELSSIALFTSTNLLVFYIFWDIGVASMFFMINSFGHALRHSAAMKFLVYSFAASMLLLFGILILYFSAPVHSFSISAISSSAIPVPMQELAFALLAIAFMIKAPIFPFHSWMPAAYAEASTSGSMLISSTLSKYGMYGMLLLFTMLPISSKFSIYIMAIAFISAFYGAVVMLRQADLKKAIAFMSMAELSILLIGISSATKEGIFGSAYGMFSHGFSVALLFLAAGAIESMYSTRNIKILGGVIRSSASTFYSFMVGVFASLGLPLTATFVADLFIFIGAYSAFGMVALVPLLAMVVIAGYAYYMISIFSSKEHIEHLSVIEANEKFGYAVLLACIFLFGIMPWIFTGMV